MTLTRDLDSTTAAIDLLGADAVMRALPQANIAADITWLPSPRAAPAEPSTSASTPPAYAPCSPMSSLVKTPGELVRQTRQAKGLTLPQLG